MPPAGHTGVRAKIGERAPDPVPQVEAEREDRDRVAQRHPPELEADHHPLVGTVRWPPGVDGVRGQVQQVVDHEQRDHHTAPAHREGRISPLHPTAGPAALVAPAAASGRGGSRPAPQSHRSINVDQHRGQQNRPDDPQRTGVRQERFTDRAQVIRVAVEGRLSGESLQVAVHVRQQPQHHDQPRDRHERLEHHRRAHRHRSLPLASARRHLPGRRGRSARTPNGICISECAMDTLTRLKIGNLNVRTP